MPLINSYGNGFDGSMMNGLQSVEQWQEFFGHPSGGTLGLFNAIQNIGALAATPFAPYFADIFGRKYCILFGASLVAIGVALQSASQNFGMFIGARAILGFGMTFAQTASPLLISELSYPTQRSALTSLFNSLWFSGAIVAAWTTFGTFRIPNSFSWRIPSILQGLPAALQLAFVWFMPESPRWLIAKGRDQKALEILAKYHGDGDVNHPLGEPQFEYKEMKETIEVETSVSKSTSWLTLFQTAGNLRRMRIIIAMGFFSQWSGNGLISYYFAVILNGIGITSSFHQTLINGILQIFNFAIAIGASLLTEKLGRRTLFLASTIGMTVFYACITICGGVFANSVTEYDSAHNPVNGNHGAANAYIAMVFLFNAAYAIAYTPLLVSYTVEILPYNIRAKGLAFMNLTVTAALVFNQYVNPVAWDGLNWKYYIVYTCWNLVECVYIYFFAVETKGRTLEECAALFDDKDAADNLRYAGEDAAHAHEEKIDEKASSTDHREHVA
ncbi:hypothetical protein BOTBODRAFT_27639 [Botryobasidium botryosum FD-172 SS1]|uniref:Major facilitator superfamily (MFS) profile domain-containing protein n=1 Tax=Botryobasidium botryosum (strain FD-172 SS1) TaxID=930990 RepID=A0A067MZU3_BOTB1|nr:hypothetical protein BOTBODRAFT_27639 [Botryobasidium botryosum FD-172 SS1]